MIQYGIGFRRQLRDEIAMGCALDCVEIIAESYLEPTPAARAELAWLHERFPIIPHGLGLSVGSVDRPSARYMDSLRRLLRDIDAPYHTDHLAITMGGGLGYGHLTPLWFTAEMLETVIANVDFAQNFLERRLVLETITHPFYFPNSTVDPADFFRQLCAQTGCEILLDVTNVFINARNFGFDARAFIERLPAEAVRHVHIVGYSADRTGRLLDTHSRAIQDELWDLHAFTMARCNPDAVIIERDDDIPGLGDLIGELDRARAIGGRDGRQTVPGTRPCAFA